ncbi:GSCOCG00001974001-RA-CDS [Cotesia congregata]|nr:GSCOCG00001974001-RA-CDS [Cotesia congregata]
MENKLSQLSVTVVRRRIIKSKKTSAKGIGRLKSKNYFIKSLNRLSKEGEGLTNEDGASTHPTLALMRRILSDAQVIYFFD